MKRILMAFALLLSVWSFAKADTAPSYPGGDEAMQAFIQENLKYPPAAKENGIEGIVHLTVTINVDGSVGTVKVDRMIDPDLEQEAIRIVKSMPAWTPGSSDSTVKIDIPFFLSQE